MEREYYNIEGLEIEAVRRDLADSEEKQRLTAYLFKAIREQSGMSRKDFSEWLGIPYRTMQEWELGRRSMPEYLLRLIAYKVRMEKVKA